MTKAKRTNKIITAEEWAKGKNCYFETDNRNNSWLWLSNGHMSVRVPWYMLPSDILDRYDNIIIKILDAMYNDLQNNYLPIDLNEENIICIDGRKYQIISF